MTVRPRTPADLPGCVRALELVHAADDYPMWWPADPAAWLDPAGTVAAWVAEQDGAMAGHVCMVGGVDDAVVSALTGVPAQRLAWVSRLYVAPPARGRAHGAALLAAASSYASSVGSTLALDVVDDGGHAVALYERLGWRLVDRRLADWTTPDGVRLPVRVYLAPA